MPSNATRLRKHVKRRAARARLNLRGHGKPWAHYLHIGKTGGTAMKARLKPLAASGRYRLDLHGHRTRLVDVPPGDKVFFAIRDPASRFVSGFHSRQRQGRPRHDVPWTPGEATAFARFTTPDELAGALFSEPEAELAMREIGHLRTSYWDWFTDEGTVRSRADDILLVARQERLDDDFEVLLERLGLPAMSLPDDAVAAHRSPPGLDRSLNEQSRANLRRWWARDYDFIELCDELFPR